MLRKTKKYILKKRDSSPTARNDTWAKTAPNGTILQSIAKCSAYCLFLPTICDQTKSALRWHFCRNSQEEIQCIS